MTTLQAIVLIVAGMGTAVMLISSIGVLRLPDVFMRMHAFGKASTLGISCLILAAALYYPEYLARMIVLILLFFLTGPIATTAIARAAYRTASREDKLNLVVNEMENGKPEKKLRKKA